MYYDSVILNYLADYSWLFIILIVWSIIWKGIALWKSARLSDKTWFIVLLIVNTVGILEIFYIFLLSKRTDSPGSPVDKNKS